LDRNTRNHPHALNAPNQGGFTLVELIVSMAIASILMIGLSTFFVTTFHNLFQAQAENSGVERQYAVNQIIGNKFETLDTLLDFQPDHILSLNKNTENQLPFTYMGSVDIKSNKYLGFKDMLVFNKISKVDGDLAYADSGDSPNSKLRKVSDGTGIIDFGVKNIAGYTKLGGAFYVAVPDQDKILKCDPTSTPICSDANINANLKSPMDVETDGIFLFISDSGNNRIIKYDLANGEVNKILATGLSFPTGLAYYKKTVNNTDYQFLFVADTFNNRILRIDLKMETFIPVVVGEGDDSTCDGGTAKYCKLDLPTALYADTDNGNNALYIADSGNDRILKMGDPGKPDTLTFNVKIDTSFALDRVELKNDDWLGGEYDETLSNLIGKKEDYNSTTKTFLNPDVLTVSDHSPCTSDYTNKIYVNEDLSGTYLKSGDTLKVGDNFFTVSGTSSESCSSGDPPVAVTKWVIAVNEAASSAVAGTRIYFAVPKSADPNLPDIKIKIGTSANKITWPGNPSAFSTTEIKFFDNNNALMKTDEQTVRVGDGILGDISDTIQVVAANEESGYFTVDDGGTTHHVATTEKIKFPTGVSPKAFANPGNDKIVYFGDPSLSPTFTPINTNFGSAEFDYINDFPLESVEFAKYNSGSILEIKIKTVPNPNENNSQQIYTHDAPIKP
jgi:prepilin-type N-terminal cleavage/methylation domain-containing protein